MGDDTRTALGALQVDERKLKGHVDEVVRSSVEETLNALLDAEADEICRAQRYEHSPERVDRRAGHYERKLETKAGEVTLKVPKLRSLPFETAIIERYRRREESVEEALVEMYLAGVSVRRVEDITEALWGTRVSSGTVSRLNQKIYRHIEAWRNREITGEFPYVYLDGVILKRSWGGEVRNVSVLVAIGVGTDGFRQILGVAEGEKEDLEGWRSFLCHLKNRGLKGVRLMISDACRGLIEAVTEVYPGTDWQRCTVGPLKNPTDVLTSLQRFNSGRAMLGTQDRWQDDLFVVGSLRDLIPEDHLLRRIDRYLDLGWLRDDVADCYCEDNGRPSIDPEAAVRLMLAGFISGTVHDRKLMREAQVNLAIRWFAGYKLHDVLPDHSSLTRIRQRWGEERFRRIFDKTVQSCVDAGLVAGDVLHIDATLVRADVSLDSLAWRHIEDVLIANAESALLEGPPRLKSKPRLVSSTDPDCAMATSSRRTFSDPSYKQHVAVDDRAGVIVDIAVTRGDVNEGNLLEQHVARAEARTGRRAGIVTADAGYAYGKVYAAMESRGVDAIIPAKAEPPPTGVIPIRRFKYDAQNQVIRCPEGKVLRRSTKTWHGWFYKASTKDCKRCRLRSSCLSPTVRRRSVVVSDGYAALLRARRRRLRWSTHEYHFYARHRWRSEGVNAEAKRWHGSRRAVRRGLKNMSIQAYLTAAVINLKRLAR